MAVTIKDVAERAGVHSSTVSRVFAGHTSISEATRLRVFAAAEALNFHPNAIAGALRTQRANSVGMVIPYTHMEFFIDPFFPEVVRGLSTELCPIGYRLLLAGVQDFTQEPEEVKRLVRSHIVDGIIIQASRLDVDTATILLDEGHPFVLLGRPLHDHPSIHWVEIDARNATRQAIEALLALGHRRIAFIGGQPDLVVTQDRVRGYQEALAAAGVRADDAWITYADFTVEGGRAAFARLQAGADAPPTALFAANDLMAVGAMLAAQAAGLHIPNDFSVIGSNDSPLAELVTPQLTSSRADYCLLAQHAARALMQQIEKPDAIEPIKQWIPSALTRRASTGPAPA